MNLASVLGYLSEVDGGADLQQALLDAIESEELREDVMGLRKEWEDKARELGRREGLEKGLEKGRAEGRAELLVKLLRLELGELGGEVVDRVRAAAEAPASAAGALA